MGTEYDPYQTRSLPREVDVLAPDGSEIRLLVVTPGCSMAHGTLPPGGVSLAVEHRTVAEVWYVISGGAELWRKQGESEAITLLAAGDSLTIPVRDGFSVPHHR